MSHVYLYFCYGLAFFAMGVAVLTFVHGTHSSLGIRELRWVGIFGLLHGASEWLVMFTFLETGSEILRYGGVLKEFVNAASYIALMTGAMRLLGSRGWRLAGLGLILLWGVSLAVLRSLGAPIVEFDAVTRLLLGSPASFLTAVAFLRPRLGPLGLESSRAGRRLAFRVVAAAFGFYGLFALIAQPSDFFPASHVNTAWFVELTGIEVAWFRALAAGAISIALLYVLRLISMERIDSLKQREHRLLAILDKSPMGVSIFSSEPFERHYVNRRFREQVGYERDAEPDAVGRETFVNPEDYQEMTDDLARGKERDNIVAQRVRPNTGELWWSAVSTRKIQFAGREAALVWVLDISDPKEREEQLAQSALQLRAILESSEAGVSVFRRGTLQRVYANQGFLRLFGLASYEDLNGMDLRKTYVNPEDADFAVEHLRSGTGPQRFAMERLRTDGSKWWAQIETKPIVFDGETATIVWHYDITEQMRSQQELEVGARRIREILDSSEAGISIFDVETFERRYVNSVFLRMFGAETIEEINAVDFRDTFESHAVAERVTAQLRNGHLMGRRSEMRRRIDGSTWWAVIDAKRIEFDGEPAVITWHYDISEQKQVENELRETVDVLRQTQNELVQAEKMASLGSLVAGVAHEINTPIGICLTSASAMTQQIDELKTAYNTGQLTRGHFASRLDRIESAADLVARNAKRAGDLISSFKKVAVDQTSDERRVFALLDYIEDVLVSLGPELTRRKIAFVLKGDRELELSGYPGAIGQIVTNLAMNVALHAYSETGGGEIEITVEHGNSGEIAMTFRDFGKGMGEEEVRRVFEPFFTTKRGKGGTGLGMHVLYNLVTQRLGGRVECRSEPGKGTTVEIRFPRVSA